MDNNPWNFKNDRREKKPSQNYRRGRFKVGWDEAVNDQEYNRVLTDLTWQNLGWRLGKLLGNASVDEQEAMYEACVQQQDP